MEKLLSKYQTLFRISIALLVIGIFSAAFAPAEAVIGKALSLVYLHIGFFAGALILLMSVLLAGFLVVFLKKGALQPLLKNAYEVAFASWFIYFLLSAAVAYLAWGGVFWQEPRMVIAVRILFIFFVALALNLFLERKSEAVVYSAASFISILIWLFRYSIMHPKAPIRNSDVTSIKVFALVSIVSTALSVILLAFSLAGRDLNRD